ncbi:LacI family DNA-binding transcriptional regulator [Brenneria tiliae]|uniref:LacI family transcriptional regulator n=1 Tax=Brenneria tiliae TaxID=2914984 RepID=A0ABT0MZA1_9GAMM|nr:LacI family DNA-binding transcriptional regulator [Brenneria tiliae]MCL2895194.1 LacI family transcriptional regulator [Brenneria tiliae]
MEKSRKRRTTGRVTLQDVANYAGVGMMTVSRALRTPEQVSDKLREKIEQAVETLGYIPNRAAGALASGYSNTIAVLLPSLADQASSTFMQSLQQVLKLNNYQLLLGCHDYNQQHEASILGALLQNNPDALVVFGSQLADGTWQSVERASVPALNIAGAGNPYANLTLTVDFPAAAQELTRHLLARGCKNIGYVCAHMDNRLQRQQLNGWHKAMLQGYQNADLVVATPDASSMRFGRDALSELLLRQPELDALVCSHENIALGVLFECQRRLIKVPGNLAIACLDGSENCDQTHPALTSVRVDYEKMGRETGKLLTAMLSESVTEPVNRPFSYRFEPGASS